MSPKENLVRHYRWLRQYGYNDSHSGNASIKDEDTVWVTPSGACADTLETGELIACGLDGAIGKRASLDAPLHVRVYQLNSATAAVLHSHGAHTIAMTLDGSDFEPVDFEGQLYFPNVPVITIPFEDYVSKSPQAVAECLAAHPITVVRGHGVYACGESLNLAYKWTCSLELSAKIAFIAQRAGTVSGLPSSRKTR
ncbi:MAG: class II aldolase/adducin family protein [Gammaproteobacteria bacterium]